MTISDVISIVTQITAITALLTSAVTTVCTIRSQERIKKAEIYSPRLYEALANMAQAYSRLTRGDALSESEREHQSVYIRAASAYYEFSSAAYTVVAVISDKEIRSEITKLIAEIRDCSFIPNCLHDEMFCNIMVAISAHSKNL